MLCLIIACTKSPWWRTLDVFFNLYLSCSAQCSGKTIIQGFLSQILPGPWLGIKPGISRIRRQHSTTRLSRRRWISVYMYFGEVQLSINWQLHFDIIHLLFICIEWLGICLHFSFIPVMRDLGLLFFLTYLTADLRLFSNQTYLLFLWWHFVFVLSIFAHSGLFLSLIIVTYSTHCLAILGVFSTDHIPFQGCTLVLIVFDNCVD